MEGAITLTLSIFCIALTSVIFLILALFGRESDERDYNDWLAMQTYCWYDYRTKQWYYRRPENV